MTKNNIYILFELRGDGDSYTTELFKGCFKTLEAAKKAAKAKATQVVKTLDRHMDLAAPIRMNKKNNYTIVVDQVGPKAPYKGEITYMCFGGFVILKEELKND